MNRLHDLQNQIARANQIYTYGGDSGIDDAVYDALKNELRKLNPSDPLLTAVGAPVPLDSQLQKVRHRHPMGSLNNVTNEEEFLKFHERMLKLGSWQEDEVPRYHLSYKMDGFSMAAFYEDGMLVKAVTRGDGEVGEDITANALRFQGLPAFIRYQDKDKRLRAADGVIGAATQYQTFTGSVRGEVMLDDEAWKRLDPDQQSNPRNLGNGIGRRKDGTDTENLKFYAFRLYNAAGAPLDLFEYNNDDGHPIQTESGMMSSLALLGFNPVTHWSQLDHTEVLKIYKAMQNDGVSGKELVSALGQSPSRDGLPYEIDGLVVKTESILLQEKLGIVSNCPVAQTAFKFPPRGAISQVQSVEISVGHTGNIIPTANLKPVKIGGVMVSRALLCNWDEIKRLDVAVGDLVNVVRRGDVIPKIVEVKLRPANRVAIAEPTTCPSCAQALVRRVGVDGSSSVMQCCVNFDCPAKQLGKIMTWIKKLDIQGLGDVFVEKLFKLEVKNPREPNRRVFLDDVSRLYECWTPEARKILAGVLGESRANKVVEQIEKKRRLTLSQFLGSLGIEGLGRRRVKIVQEKCPKEFDTLEDWTSGKLITMAEAAGLPESAKRIQAHINYTVPLMARLKQAGVEIVAEDAPPVKKEGAMTFCITGTLSQPKDHFHSLMVAKGHTFVTSYKKGIDYLVAADPQSGSIKLQKAAKDGVKVISEAELLELLG